VASDGKGCPGQREVDSPVQPPLLAWGVRYDILGIFGAFDDDC
jgi:hypothetical protein